MIDINRVTGILGEISYYITEFREISPDSRPDLNDRRTYYAVSMILFTILNCVIELGEELVTGRKLGVPATYRDIFRRLGKAQIISPEMERDLASLVYYRNRLSHQYADFDADDLRSVIAKLPVIVEFTVLAKNELQK